MQPNLENMEQDLITLMDGMYKVLSVLEPNAPSSALRSKIVAANLKGMVQVILLGDDPESDVKVNLKALCLGLLAAADWLDPEEGVSDVTPSSPDAEFPQT